MPQGTKHFQRELKSIALHFSLQLSQISILLKQAIGIDIVRRKMILLERRKQSHFRIINLEKVTSCSMKVVYKNIAPGELEGKNMDEFIDKLSLKLQHIDESKSIDFVFTNDSGKASKELVRLRPTLKKLKNALDIAIHKQTAKRA